MLRSRTAPPSSAESSSAPTSERRRRAATGSRKERTAHREPFLHLAVKGLIVIVLLLCLADVYYLNKAKGTGRIDKVREGLKHQKDRVLNMLHRAGGADNENEGGNTNSNNNIRGGADPYAQQQQKRKLEPPLKSKAKFAQGGVGVLRLNKDGEGDVNDPNHSAGLKEVIDGARAEARKRVGVVAGLADMSDDEINTDKDELFEILEQAGIEKKYLDKEIRYAIPTWTRVKELYGDHPVILGLDRCQDFKPQPDWSLAFFGISGFFNTGE